MLNQKGFAPLVIILGVGLLVIIVSLSFYLGAKNHCLLNKEVDPFCSPMPSLPPLPSPPLTMVPEVEIITPISYSKTDTKITYAGDWDAAEINEDQNYRHSVNIFYPASWLFSCCGDMGNGSGHILDPNPLDPNRDVKPSITIFDFALQGCPNENDCSLEKLQKLTPAKFMSNMVKNLEDGTGPLGLKDLKKTTFIKLNKFIGDIPVYEGLSSTVQPVQLYLIHSSKGVVGIIIQQPQVFDETLKMDFLNRLTPN